MLSLKSAKTFGVNSYTRGLFTKMLSLKSAKTFGENRLPLNCWQLALQYLAQVPAQAQAMLGLSHNLLRYWGFLSIGEQIDFQPSSSAQNE